LERYIILPDALDRRKATLMQQVLREIRLPKDFNTAVYAVEGGDTQGAVLLRPRIVVRSSALADRLEIHDAPGGQVALHVAFALVDGLSPELASGSGSVLLADEFLVHGRDEFISALEKALGGKPVFLSSVPCPEEVDVQAKGTDRYPIELKSAMKTCPLNVFFPAVIRMKRTDWEALAETFLESGSVELKATYNLTTPIVLEHARLALKQAVLGRALGERFGETGAAISPAALDDGLSDLMRRIQESWGVEYPVELLGGIRDQIADAFVRRETIPNCPAGLDVCFFLKRERLAGANGVLQAELQRAQPFGRPLRFESSSAITDALSYHQEFLIHPGQGDLTVPPAEGELSPLFRTVGRGELAEFRIKQMSMTAVSFGSPMITPVSNRVCLDPYASCVRGDWNCLDASPVDYDCVRRESSWTDVPVDCYVDCPTEFGVYLKHWTTDAAHDCTQCRPDNCSAAKTSPMSPGPCANPDWYRHANVKVARFQNHVPNSWFDDCKQKPACTFAPKPAGAPQTPYRIGSAPSSRTHFWEWTCADTLQGQCDPDKWEDHWVRTTTWSLPSLTPRLAPVSLTEASWQQLLRGLSVRFTWVTSAGKQQVTCPISAMETRVLPPNRLIVHFENTQQCAPFTEDNSAPGRAPSIALINQIALPSEFQCGSLAESWDGKRRYVCRLPDGSATESETTRAEDEARLARGEKLGIYQPYYPRVELQGAFRIVGSYFENRGETL
jgi:hypothetical protein